MKTDQRKGRDGGFSLRKKKKLGRGGISQRRERRGKQGKFVCRRKEMIFFGGEEDGSLEPSYTRKWPQKYEKNNLIL